MKATLGFNSSVFVGSILLFGVFILKVVDLMKVLRALIKALAQKDKQLELPVQKMTER